MDTLKEVLSKNEPALLLEAAKEVGFKELRLFKPAVAGILGIYAGFADGVADQYHSRALALTYKLSEILATQVVIVSSYTDVDGSIRENSVAFEEIGSQQFKQVFSEKWEKMALQSNHEPVYQSNMVTYKIFYDRLVNPNNLKEKMGSLETEGLDNTLEEIKKSINKKS